MKKITALLLSVIVTFSVFGGCFVSASDEYPITVVIDGKTVNFDVPPQIINNRTMVPMRAIFEALGAEVSWDDASKTAISEKDGIRITITIGEYRIVKNGEDIEIDVPAQIVDSRTLVPIRAISECFECTVEWYDMFRIVSITTPVKIPAEVKTEADTRTVMKAGGKDISFAWLRYSMINLYNSGCTVNQLEEEAASNIKEYIASELLADDYQEIINSSMISDYVTETVAATIRNDAGGDTEAYYKVLADANLTDSLYRYLLKNMYVNSYIYDTVFVGDGENSIVSDEEILYYIKSDYIRVKHILINTTELDDDGKANARARAEKIRAEALSGKSFEDLITAYSEDGMDVDTGYYFTYGQMVSEFEEASYALEVGEISDIVESAYGYHIIKKYEMDDSYILENEDLKLTAKYDIGSNRYYTILEEKANSLEIEYTDEYAPAVREIMSEIIPDAPGGIYENAELGIGCELPSGWRYMSSEELDQLVGSDSVKVSEIFNVPVAASTADGTNFTLSVYDYKNMGLESAEQLYDVQANDLDFLDDILDSNISAKSSDGEFIGRKCRIIDISHTLNGYIIYQKLYLFINNNSVCMLTITSFDENKNDEISSYFYSVE